jgi:hypothetical protein
MSEEVRHASLTVPRVLVGSAFLNAVLAFLMVITLIFCIGDESSVINTATGEPFIQLFFDSTRSLAATNTLSAVLIVMMTCGVVNGSAAASRQLWSFARDKGLPGSSWLSVTDRTQNIPLHAVSVTVATAAALACINIGYVSFSSFPGTSPVLTAGFQIFRGSQRNQLPMRECASRLVHLHPQLSDLATAFRGASPAAKMVSLTNGAPDQHRCGRAYTPVPLFHLLAAGHAGNARQYELE